LKLFFDQGGSFVWIIFGFWIISMLIAGNKFWQLQFKFDIDGSSFMNELQRYVLSNDIPGGIRICSGTIAALPRVLKGGLKRAYQSMDQIQNALDATALEVIPKIEKRLTWLTLNANLSMLLGLLGTIHGLIIVFSAIAKADPSQKSQILAQGISTAMNTTAMGLFSAITILLAHAFLQNKATKIINEIDEFSVKLLDLISTKNNKEIPEAE
jgi:biopolymer transport protein ExbB/TolQ